MKNKVTAHLTRFRVLLLCVSLLLVVCVSIVGSVEAGHMTALRQTAPGNQQTAPATQTAPAEKTVEQVQKNIQVLTGLPASQLIPVMNYIGSSLGVKCTYCHVNKDGKWDFVSDEKPEKGTARGMIRMVSNRGIRDLESIELFYLKRYPDVSKDIKFQGQFTRISFGGKDKIDGKDVYVLRGLGVDGKGERLYFDAQTGLLLRRITSTPTVVGLIPEQVDFEDYRDVDGLKLPFTIRITSIDSFFTSTRKFTEIKLNLPVDETKFNKPAPTPAPAVTRLSDHSQQR